MSVYSRVQIDDEEGDGNDNWICDSYTQKIGAGSGFWMRRVSTREIILMDKDFSVVEAKLIYEKWPWTRNTLRKYI